MFEIIFLVVLAAFAIGGIWAYVVSKKVKEEGIETDAVVSNLGICCFEKGKRGRN